MDTEALVCVVEDDAPLRASLTNLLRSVGLRVAAFASAQEFLRSPRPEGPSCLVLDVRLPGLSGLELQQQLVAGDLAMPIIFITGHGDIPMTVQAMKAGAVDFLSKPFRDQALLDLVDAGPSALEALLRASTSADLELAWRAGEAVQMACRSADAEAPAIHKELARLAKLDDKPVAKLASEYLQKWPLYRHEYAAAELTLLGARVGDVESGIAMEHTGAAGVFLVEGGLLPIGGPAEAAAIDEDVELEAPVVEKIPLIGGLFRAIGRAAGGIHAADEARGGQGRPADHDRHRHAGGRALRQGVARAGGARLAVFARLRRGREQPAGPQAHQPAVRRGPADPRPRRRP